MIGVRFIFFRTDVSYMSYITFLPCFVLEGPTFLSFRLNLSFIVKCVVLYSFINYILSQSRCKKQLVVMFN